ncbi:TRAF3-interacting protein 1-like [Aulostomus maculatus]
MNEAVIKTTQDTLGKVIKKPPLTEKLLSRPPFRYLHDIFSEVIKTTGFMKGLYDENEMQSDNVTEKDTKITFLQKAIDVVMLVSGEPLTAKPSRIVAGLQPERTNEMLQAIAKCCLNKLSSEEAVKRVLAGEKLDMKTKASTSRAKDKENREGRERHLDRQERRKSAEATGNGDHKDLHQPRELESRHRDREKEHRHERERSDKHHRHERERSDREKDRERDREQDKDKGRVNDRDREKDKEKEERNGRMESGRSKARVSEPQQKDNPEKPESQRRDREKEHHHEREPSDRHHRRQQDHTEDKCRDRERVKDRDREKDRERDREMGKDQRRDKDREKTRERDRERHREKRKEESKRLKEGEERNGQMEIARRMARVSEEPQQSANPEVSRNPAKPVPASGTPAGIPRPSSAKGQQRRSKFACHDNPDSKGDGEAQVAQGPVPQENGDAAGSTVPSIMAFSTRRMPRPSSARPAPPRVKPQDTATGGTPAERQSCAKPSKAGIMDRKQPSEVKEDDDEQFIVEDAVSSPTDAPEKHLKPAHKLSSGPKHGGFEKKVLENKNDHQSSQSSTTSEDQSLVSEEAQKKEQDLFIQEMEQLLSSIQTVCCSILPLREIMDHLQEDMEAMQAELHTWQRENKKYTEALQQEQRVTDEAMEPLQAELAELEQLIKDQQDKICVTKCNIMKNDEKINKMLTGMNCSNEI